jgi:hypothetical protein
VQPVVVIGQGGQVLPVDGLVAGRRPAEVARDEIDDGAGPEAAGDLEQDAGVVLGEAVLQLGADHPVCDVARCLQPVAHVEKHLGVGGDHVTFQAAPGRHPVQRLAREEVPLDHPAPQRVRAGVDLVGGAEGARVRRGRHRRVAQLLDQQQRLDDPKVGLGQGDGVGGVVRQVVRQLPAPVRRAVGVVTAEGQERTGHGEISILIEL